AGKLRVKYFRAPPRAKKTAYDHSLEHPVRQQSRAWQGTGREARKLSDRRLASNSHCLYNNLPIDNYEPPCHMVRNFVVARGLQGRQCGSHRLKTTFRIAVLPSSTTHIAVRIAPVSSAGRSTFCPAKPKGLPSSA